jgi:hypothetical protein
LAIRFFGFLAESHPVQQKRAEKAVASRRQQKADFPISISDPRSINRVINGEIRIRINRKTRV